MRCIELYAVVLLDHMACFCQSWTTSDHRDHSHGPGPHRTGIVTSKMNRCSRSGTLLHFFLTDNTEVLQCAVYRHCAASLYKR